jgi:anti-sigma regulatory factor (Ser/Thr protein kinase)
MVDSSPNLLLMEVPCDRRAPALVRNALAEAHDMNSRMSDGLLVASELVTNAVLRSGCEAEHMLEVRAGIWRNRLRISVHDRGTVDEGATAERTSEPDSRPWGMRIIEGLSRRWGCDRPGGYRVWAELALPA